MRIEIVKGDLFVQDCNIVVGTCDTFDTLAPNIIAKSSIQGQALERLYGGDLQKLDLDLASALQGSAVRGSIQKPGKTDKYGVGAVATLRHGSHRLYFLAYSEMDTNNEAQSTPDAIWRSSLRCGMKCPGRRTVRRLQFPLLAGGASLASRKLSQRKTRSVSSLCRLCSRHALRRFATNCE